MTKYWLGKNRSEETKIKISEKLKGRSWKPDRFCLVCGKNGVRKGRKYCSQICAGVSSRGKKPWIVGKKHTEESKKKMSLAKIGKKHSVEQNIKHKIYALKQENHYKWKGESVGYIGLHNWVRKYKGKPTECNVCGEIKKTQWANIDHRYRRVLEDFISLCPKCHQKYDREKNGYKRSVGASI